MDEFTDPSDLELQVLSVLWRLGPSTAREVLAAMPDGKKRAYTTILSVMQVMEKKKLLKHSNRGKTYVYRPTRTQSEVLKPTLREMVRNVFGGKRTAAMQMLLDDEISSDELAEIQQLLEKVKTERGQ